MSNLLSARERALSGFYTADPEFRKSAAMVLLLLLCSCAVYVCVCAAAAATATAAAATYKREKQMHSTPQSFRLL